jgi:hypothetical protein
MGGLSRRSLHNTSVKQVGWQVIPGVCSSSAECAIAIVQQNDDNTVRVTSYREVEIAIVVEVAHGRGLRQDDDYSSLRQTRTVVKL